MAIYESQSWLDKHIRRLFTSALLVVFVMLSGTLGYVFIEGWSLNDAFYMTIITLSTVGFEEVHQLSDAGQLFTACLILTGVGAALYSGTAVAQSLIEGEIKKFRGFQRMQKKISHLNNHTIVCGYGRLSQMVVKGLLEHKQNVVIIENDPKKIEMLNSLDVLYVEGSAYDDEVLKAAGITKAKCLVALLSKDSDNVYVSLSAKDLNPNIKVMARSEQENGETKLKRAGADQVIATYRVSGNRIVQQLVRPNVMDFLEITSDASDKSLAIEEMRVPENSKLIGKTLEESALRGKTGAMIAAFIDSKGTITVNPGRESIIEEGATMIVFGEKESLKKLEQLVSN